MTREEYRLLTDIQSTEEAKSYLETAKRYFWAVSALGIVMKVGVKINEGFILLMIPFLILLVFFIVFCFRMVRKTRGQAKTSAVWSFLAAPLSWAWFYPALVRPYRVIAGELEPEAAPVASATNAITLGAPDEHQRLVLKITGVIIFLTMVLTIILVSQDKSGADSDVYVNAHDGIYETTSARDGLKINFPGHPSYKVEDKSGPDSNLSRSALYKFDGRTQGYRVQVLTFSNVKMTTDDPDYEPLTVFKNMATELAESTEEHKITMRETTASEGHPALRFKIDAGDDTILEGLVTQAGFNLYRIIASYKKSDSPDKATKFIESFELLSAPISVSVPK